MDELWSYGCRVSSYRGCYDDDDDGGHKEDALAPPLLNTGLSSC